MIRIPECGTGFVTMWLMRVNHGTQAEMLMALLTIRGTGRVVNQWVSKRVCLRVDGCEVMLYHVQRDPAVAANALIF